MENVAWGYLENCELGIKFVFEKGEEQKAEEECVIEGFVIYIYNLIK